MTNGAKIFFWRVRTLYLGPLFSLSPHRNAVPVLCASLGGTFRVAIDPKKGESGYCGCRVALIPANTIIHLLGNSGPMAFLYVDGQSDDYRCLQAKVERYEGKVGLRLAGEERYLAALRRLQAGAAWEEAREEIASTLGLTTPVHRDQRIAEIIRQMHRAPDGSAELAALARSVGLSSSRFLHLFKEATGVPFRRYRLWARMGIAVRGLAAGNSLTEAALKAGFSSSAHFSAAFREMFGMAPSQLAKSAPTIIGSGRAKSSPSPAAPPAS